jgi:ribosomal protein L11 methyltransferase
MIRLAIRCKAENAELALAQLIDLAPGGIEEIREGDIVEYAVYGPPGEVPTLPDLQVAVGDDLVEVRTTEVADDWQERWRDFHHAMDITAASGSGDRSIFLRPSWEDTPVPENALEVVLDPGQAFGTGSHPTTRLCVAHLLDIEPGGGFLDLGCGSGVLAIAAAKLGWGPVSAYDFDQLAVDATLVNADDNDVELTAEKSDVRSVADGLPPLAPTVFVNILRPVLIEIADQLPEEHGITALVLSGLLDEEADEVAAAFAPHGLREVARNSEGGWTGLRLSA